MAHAELAIMWINLVKKNKPTQIKYCSVINHLLWENIPSVNPKHFLFLLNISIIRIILLIAKGNYDW